MSDSALQKFMQLYPEFVKTEAARTFMIQGIADYAPICELIYEGNTQKTAEIFSLWENVWHKTQKFVSENLDVKPSFQEVMAISMLGSMHANAAAELYDQSYELDKYKRNRSLFERAAKQIGEISKSETFALFERVGIGGDGKGLEGQAKA